MTVPLDIDGNFYDGPEVEEFNEGISPEEGQEIINSHQIDLWGKFEPTFYQHEWYEHFTQRDEAGRLARQIEGVAVVPRRHGKTTGVLKCVVLPWLLERPNLLYVHAFPTLGQGRGAIWNGQGNITTDPDERAISYLEMIPRELWKKKHNSEMSLELINGSVYRIVGVRGHDGTANHLRGLNAQGVIADEFGEWRDGVISEIFGPMIAQNGGFIFKIGTPKGENHFYQDYLGAKALQVTNPRIKAWHYRCDELYYNNGERIISDDYIQRELARGVDPEIIQQEYYCNFRSVSSGAYYRAQMARVADESRACRVPHHTDYPAYAFWDIGKNGTNAVWVCQFPSEERINCIYFDCDPDLSLYEMHMKLHRTLEYPIKTHFYPWDGNSPESTGMTKVEFVRERGVTDDIVVIKRTGTVQEGIEYAKALFPRVWFDEDKCSGGIMCLKNYVKQVSISNENYGDPLKNKFIHGADSFRTMATAVTQGEVPIGKHIQVNFSNSVPTYAQFDDLEL